MTTPYFFTWTKQDEALKLDIQTTTADSYILTNNKEVVDLSSCSYHLGLGLRNSVLEKAIVDQLSTLPVAGPKLVYDLKENCSNDLLELLNLEGKIFYTTSGAESVENALKIVRQATGKKKIIARSRSYHGASAGALSVTGDWRKDGHLTHEEYTVRIPEPDSLNSIEKTLDIIKENAHECAAIILETVTGGNGVVIPSKQWWQQVITCAKEHGIKVILDEVVCGFYRTGKPFGFHHFDIKPDIVCMAKTISGGFFAFGAVYVEKSLASYFDKNTLSCGLTNYAHPIGLRLCSSVIEIINSTDFQTNFNQLAQTLTDFKNQITDYKNVHQVRMIGLLMAIDIGESDLKWQELIDAGIYINLIRGSLILCPIMTMDNKRLLMALSKLDKILRGL